MSLEWHRGFDAGVSWHEDYIKSKSRHKWYYEIKAWADGAIIQYKDSNDLDEWVDCIDNEPFWEVSNTVEYRIKHGVLNEST
jgi:hypothetical protein